MELDFQTSVLFMRFHVNYKHLPNIYIEKFNVLMTKLTGPLHKY